MLEKDEKKKFDEAIKKSQEAINKIEEKHKEAVARLNEKTNLEFINH